ALLVHEDRYLEEFSIRHTSTFADDGLSSFVAEEVLHIITADRLAEQCRSKGQYFRQQLEALQQEFPSVIQEVRGKGLMLGLAFKPQASSPSNFFRMISASEYFGYLLAGHLLQEHRIRIMPTLSNPNTLRIQPSAYIQPAQMDEVITALRQVCQLIENADAGNFIRFLIGEKAGSTGKSERNDPLAANLQAPNLKKVAFLGHLIRAENMKLWDVTFSPWSNAELEQLIDRVGPFLEPMVFDQVQVQDALGNRIHLKFIGLFLDARLIERAYRSRDYSWILDKIQQAVHLAEQEHCEVLGLGASTSILSNNGKRLQADKIRLTTGNALTVGAGLQAARQSIEQLGMRLATCKVGIIGAKGNIGTLYTNYFAQKSAALVLVLRETCDPTLQNWIAQLQSENPQLQLEATTDLCALQNCDILIAASNSNHPILHSRHLSERNKILIDIAVPSDVDD
ncbi:MAG: aminotransferase class III-fold pyridoxal phosphate-dependent enzyme, partial [Phaeodactylibacter sp.]|nr:aminotransferase class III-fold pyridoxal phosphate-dependent enzyme [Phaeodactylibacter sp.]